MWICPNAYATATNQSPWRSQVSWEYHQSTSCFNEYPTSITEQKLGVIHYLAKSSGSRVLSSPINHCIQLVYSTMTSGFHFMPGILTYSTVHFSFLPSWNLHSPAHFLSSNRPRGSIPSHSPSIHLLATIRSANPLGHPSSPGFLRLYCFMYLLIWSNSHPSQPFQILCYSTVLSIFLCSPFKRFLFSHTLYVYKLGDNAFLNIVSNVSCLRSSKFPSPPRLMSSITPLTSYSSHFLASTSSTICLRPWLTVFLFTHFNSHSWWLQCCHVESRNNLTAKFFDFFTSVK